MKYLVIKETQLDVNILNNHTHRGTEKSTARHFCACVHNAHKHGVKAAVSHKPYDRTAWMLPVST